MMNQGVVAVLMARAQTGTANPVSRSGVRIVVAGDRGTGKSSLIATAAYDSFPANVAPLLPPTSLTEDFYPDKVPITLIDTSSRYEIHYFVCSNICMNYKCVSTFGFTLAAPFYISSS